MATDICVDINMIHRNKNTKMYKLTDARQIHCVDEQLIRQKDEACLMAAEASSQGS